MNRPLVRHSGMRTNSSEIDLAGALDALARLVAKYVADELQASGPTSDEFSSVNLPPDCPSRARFNQICRQIPAASKRGRVWFIGVSDWDTHRRLKKNDKAAKDAQASETPSVSDIVLRSIERKFRQIA